MYFELWQQLQVTAATRFVKMTENKEMAVSLAVDISISEWKKANWKNNNTWNNAKIHCLNVAVFHRHGWAESLTEIQPPYVKIICPNACVSCFFCFAIISPDIVLRCSDKLKKKKQIFTFLVARVVYEPVVQPQYISGPLVISHPNNHVLISFLL